MEDIQDRKLSEVIPILDNPDLSSLKQPEIGGFIEVHGNHIAVNRVPVLVQGKFFAGIITFQELSQIQKIETRIRKEVNQKGLVASYDFSQMLGTSEALQEVKKLALDYAKVQSNILLGR